MCNSNLTSNLELTDTVLAKCGRTNSTPGEEEAYGHGTYCKPEKGRRTVFGLEQQHKATVYLAGLFNCIYSSN